MGRKLAARHNHLHAARTAGFLSTVGPPDSDVFTCRADVEDPYGPDVDEESQWSLSTEKEWYLGLDPGCDLPERA